MKKVVVFKNFSDKDAGRIREAAGNCEVVFAGRVDREEEKKLLADADICIGEPAWESIQESRTLRLVQMTWAGTDIYTRASRPFPAGVHLCNASGAFGPTMSQYALGAVLNLYRRFPEYQKKKENCQWKFAGIEKSIIGTTLLIYGSGNIGSCCARLFRALGAEKIIGVRRKADVPAEFDMVCTLEEAENYLPQADIVIGCMPNTDDNQGHLNAKRIAMMKDDAVLVNMGRGPFVDNLALASALDGGKLFGAALDVTSPEPLPEDHPLWKCDRLILTPHISGPSFGNPQTEKIIADICCENISRLIAGEQLINQIY